MIEFRPGVVEDLPALRAVELAADTLYEGHVTLGSTATDPASLVRAAAAGRLDVAMVDGEPVGFLLAEVLDGTFHVEEVDVHPAQGRRGIGRALLRRALARAASDGLRAVTLTTFRDLPWNEPFYRSLGFEAVDPGDVGPELVARWHAQGRSFDLYRRVAMRRRVGFADLHRHLDGSLRSETLRELVGEVPADFPFRPGMGLDAALDRFAVVLGGLQGPDVVRRVAAEMCEDAAADGVTTLEVRFAPQLHRGAAPEAIVDAALEGLAGRAGLILCGLYGESPAVLERNVAIAGSRPGVVGIDLAGGPTRGQWHRMEDYAAAFGRARELGLGRTVHAGEGRPPQEIRLAVEVLHAQRIGHGTTLLDDAGVLELVLREGVTIEACPTSNWHVGAVPEPAAHPLPRWLQLGVAATVCCDNTLLSQVVSSEEHRRAAELPDMTELLLQRSIDLGHAGAFHR